MVASVRTEGYGGSRQPFTMADLRTDRNQLKVKKMTGGQFTFSHLNGNTGSATYFGHNLSWVFISKQIIWFLTCSCKHKRRVSAFMLQKHNDGRWTLDASDPIKDTCETQTCAHQVSEVSAVSNRNFLRLLVQTTVTVCWSRPTCMKKQNHH